MVELGNAWVNLSYFVITAVVVLTIDVLRKWIYYKLDEAFKKGKTAQSEITERELLDKLEDLIDHSGDDKSDNDSD